MKVLLENLLRFEDGVTVTRDDLQAMADWLKDRSINREIQYRPARVLMQDFTGVPAVVDLAAMRDAMKQLGGDPQKINPQVPVHLVIDHSVMVDEFGTPKVVRAKMSSWNISATPSATNSSNGAARASTISRSCPRAPASATRSIWNISRRRCGPVHDQNGDEVAYPDTLVGTDSHTTMVNGLGVLGWGVGGIEAEAAMLGQPVSMLIPEVVGFRLDGGLKEGITATDLVLTVTQMLRAKGVVGRFVEFFGPGLDALSLADRATIANMAPEYGATCGFFPVDERTIDYLKLTGRDDERIELVRAYCKAQGLWRDASSPEPLFTDTLELDMSSVEPSLAGPKRPQDRVRLSDVDELFNAELSGTYKKEGGERVAIAGEDYHHRPWRRDDRRDHQLHQHLQPVGAGRRRTGRAQGPRARPRPQAVGQDQPRAGQPGGDRLSRLRRPVSEDLERDRLQPRRLWLHHLHRQFGPARSQVQRGDRRP